MSSNTEDKINDVAGKVGNFANKAEHEVRDAVDFAEEQAGVVKNNWKTFAIVGGAAVALVIVIAIVL